MAGKPEDKNLDYESPDARLGGLTRYPISMG